VDSVRAAFHKDSLFRFENHASLTDALQKFRQAQGNTGVTLDKCFETFTKPERLDEHNMWYCSQCKEHVRAMKTMQLWRLPNILVITLKRFEFKHILRRDKLDTLVDFPLDGLDMSKHCAYSARTNGDSFVQDSVPAVYDLFGVTNHYGRMGFGHYTAFARRWDENGMSNDWALFDDASVQSVGDGRGVNGRNGIVSPAAYILFYRRRTFH
jgi:ubiquitin C-terminal hydrolase